VEFGILGPVQVQVQGRPVQVGGARTRAVLAMLVIQANRVVAAEAMASQLWPGLGRERAAANLQVRLSQLRRALRAVGEADRVLTQAPGYLLRAEAGEVDALRFAGLVAQGRALLAGGEPTGAAARLEEALGLWRGLPLAGLEDAEWASGEAARLGEARLAALELRVDAQLAAGEAGELAGELEALTAAHPLRERFWEQRMLALYRAGRQAEALGVYQQARQTLVGELAIEPSTGLRDLHARILAQDPALAGAAGGPSTGGSGDGLVAPRQLPAGARQFAARGGELKALDVLLGQACGPGDGRGMVVIALIVGTGGVGKTTLAVHWAHQVADKFPDGQLYVNLRGFDPAGAPVTSAEAVRWFLDGLGVPAEQIPASRQAQVGLYRSLTASKRLLVVLDNAAEPGQVRPLLPTGPSCLVLVTSRSGLAGLVAADGAVPVRLDALSEEEAAQLLAARLGPERLAAEPSAASALARLCAGLPLALAVTAARAAARPDIQLAVLASHLAGEPDRLDAFDTGEEPTSLRAVLSWSYRQLSGPAARLFRLLGIHPGPDISGPAAASLAGVPVRHARMALAELTAASLISQPLPGRYAFHDLLRAYAAGQARQDGKAGQRAAIGRVLDHYLQTASRAEALFRNKATAVPMEIDRPRAGVAPECLADRAAAMAWFQAERQVLVSVIALAGQAGFDRHGWQLPSAVWYYLYLAAHWQDRETVSRFALDAAGRLGDHAALGHAHLAMGSFLHRSGAGDDAVAHLSEALRHFQVTADLTAQAHVQVLLSEIGRSDQSNFRVALEHAEHALALYREVGNRTGEAYALGLIGVLHVRLGDPELGVGYCQESLASVRELGDPVDIAAALDSLGRAQTAAGNVRAAIACCQEATTLWKQAGTLAYQAHGLFGLGDAYDAAGDDQAAGQAWRQALDLIGCLHHPSADRVRAWLRQQPAGRAGHATPGRRRGATLRCRAAPPARPATWCGR
jgi:DNA-binding SARP family transcriptional activator/tetratricopeptide (TPR) repeat protein